MIDWLSENRNLLLRLLGTLVATLLIVLLSATAHGQWDRFRGPNGTGVSDSGRLPTEFGTQSNALWRVELAPGHSSPIISNYWLGIDPVRGGHIPVLAFLLPQLLWGILI